jgi:hypothetical protein
MNLYKYIGPSWERHTKNQIYLLKTNEKYIIVLDNRGIFHNYPRNDINDNIKAFEKII